MPLKSLNIFYVILVAVKIEPWAQWLRLQVYVMSLTETILLGNLYPKKEKHSLYSSTEEFQRLIKEVLSWDIRSLSQQSWPHYVTVENENGESNHGVNCSALSRPLDDITYHLIVEGVDISYRIDVDSNIVVEKVTPLSDAKNLKNCGYNYLMWREKLGQLTCCICCLRFESWK